MMTLLDFLLIDVESGASQEDMQTRDYAEGRINAMSNYELAEALSEAFQQMILLNCGDDE